VYGGRLSGAMYFSQEACIVVCRGVVSLGKFLCYVAGGRGRVALRVSREVRREILGHVLSPFGILDIITLVFWICRVYYSSVWRCIVRRLFQICIPSSHRGARCLSSLLE
jgi:hypothetical protein